MRAILVLAWLCVASAQASPPSALVWLPPENFTAWPEVDQLLRSRSNLKLTVALTPELAQSASPLIPWAERGRVEFAVRIAGDPILPLTAWHPMGARPQDVMDRAHEDRALIIERLKTTPRGLAVFAGAVDAPLVSMLGASGYDWILVGPYAESDAPWVRSGKSLFIPARLLNTGTSDVSVFDESTSTISAISTLLNAEQNWVLISELARQKNAFGAVKDVSAWPSWDAISAARPPIDPGARAYWDAYGAAAAAVNRYQNSGSADLETLEKAAILLRNAQASRHFRAAAAAWATGGEKTIPGEQKTALIAVYDILQLPAPGALFEASSSTIAAASFVSPTGVSATSGSNWIEFSNPPGTLAFAPILSGSTMNALGDTAAAADPWRIRGLRAEWDETTLRLIIRTSARGAAPRPMFDVYIDVNNVLGAGRVSLLEGRAAVLPARDAWEMALTLVGNEARLYRARGGNPEEIMTVAADLSPAKNEYTVVLPRAAMRGNPARWGWAVIAMAEDPARAGRRPAAPLIGGRGPLMLGVLAPLNAQKAILTRPNPRVPVARQE